jgi:hypothetical protein
LRNSGSLRNLHRGRKNELLDEDGEGNRDSKSAKGISPRKRRKKDGEGPANLGEDGENGGDDAENGENDNGNENADDNQGSGDGRWPKFLTAITDKMRGGSGKAGKGAKKPNEKSKETKRVRLSEAAVAAASAAAASSSSILNLKISETVTIGH